MSIKPERFQFAVFPSDLSKEPLRFNPFILEVPTLMGQEAAGRRAYLSAMAILAGQDVDIEEFSVCQWDPIAGNPGPLVEGLS